MDMMCGQRMILLEAARRAVFMDLWYHSRGLSVVLVR